MDYQSREGLPKLSPGHLRVRHDVSPGIVARADDWLYRPFEMRSQRLSNRQHLALMGFLLACGK